MSTFLHDYFISGLDNNELCIWMTPDVESTLMAKEMLKEKGIDIDIYLRNSQLEIVPIPELPGNDLSLLPALLPEHWKLMNEQATLSGFDGLRFNVDLNCIEGSCLDLLRSYNDVVKDTVKELAMRSICTCSLGMFSPSEILELESGNDNFIISTDEQDFSFRKNLHSDKQDVLVSGGVKQKSEELISIYESSPAIAFLWKTEKGFPVEYVSDNVVRLGYDAESLMSHELLYADIIHPDDVEGYYSDLLACLKENRRNFSKEYRILDKSGNVHWISEHSRLEVDENGLSDRYHGIILDITGKKSFEDELKRSIANYRTLFEEFVDAIYVQDPDGNFLEVNRSALELLGYTHEEFLSCNSDCLLHPDHAEEFKIHMAKVLENEISEFESVLMRKDGSYIPVEINVSTMKYRGKDSVLVVLEDITERRKKEENLSAVKASAETGAIAKCEFLSNMTHELRTPLNAIIGFSDVLLEDSDVLDDRHVKFVHNISDSGKKLLGIINDVLDMSRLESGNVELHYEHFLVWESFDIVSSSFAQMAERKNVELNSELEPRGIVINADKQKFEQILQNLLDNAIKFTPAGGSVDLSGRFVNERLLVQVKDNGIGIPEEDCNFLFESFTQADGSYRRGYGGSGLGLAIVKRFVEMHGGNVWVKSKPGVGSSFSFDIPIAIGSPQVKGSVSVNRDRDKNVSNGSECINSGSVIDSIHSGSFYDATENVVLNKSPVSTFDATSKNTIREILGPDNCTDDDPLILVVEDDEISRELLMLTLIDGGYRVVPAVDGVEGLSFARRLKPFAITLDIMLPRLDGWEVLNQLKADASTCDIPVVVVSMLDQKEAALELGAADYMGKPFDREYLLHLMDRFKMKRDGKCPKVLLVDDEPYAVDILSSMLESEGFTILRAYSAMDAIDICTKDQPDIMILDLMMPDLSGFDVISTLRTKTGTRNLPIILCTGKELSPREHLFLEGKVDSIMQKGDFSKRDLLDAVHHLIRYAMSK
ncbi:response regulator [Methanococcoides sp. FTZ1]|uniref:response regulator n=1 Tax=Methanococcoides sp. FTZ1 TaxID=3439061 RepID=UPI003F83DF6E